MLEPSHAREVLRNADLICDEQSVRKALVRMAGEISARLADSNPLILSEIGRAHV